MDELITPARFSERPTLVLCPEAQSRGTIGILSGRVNPILRRRP